MVTYCDARLLICFARPAQPEPAVARFRKDLEKVAGDKHAELMARMGAIMATGILDAGGRNCTVVSAGAR